MTLFITRTYNKHHFISLQLGVIRPSSLTFEGALSPIDQTSGYLPLHSIVKVCLPNPYLHTHIQANVMVSLNLFPKNAKPASAQEQQDVLSTTNVFEHARRHLADYRNICQVYHVRAYQKRDLEIDTWANDLLKTLWTVTTAKDPG